MRLPLLALVVVLLALLGQNAAPSAPGSAALSATPADRSCPVLPPATPSPTPTPAPEPPLGIGPTPTPAPDSKASVDPLLSPQVATAAALLEACWNQVAWDTVARIVTPRFLETALGITASDDQGRALALATLDLGPLQIESVGPITIWSDGRGAVDVRYRRGRGQPLQAVAARWFLRAERGVVRFDEERLLPPLPLGDRVTIGFALAGDPQPLQWASLAGGQIPASPVIALHGANHGRTAHTFVLENGRGETLGLLTLPAYQQGDLVLLDLPPGAYRLHAPALPGPPLAVTVDEGDGVMG